jgi:hypothetical protein
VKIRGRLANDRLVVLPDGEWVRECAPGWIPAFSAGLRYISIDEEFIFTAEGANPATQNARYAINTQNDLVGFQLGLDMIEQHCNWSYGIRGKVGGMVNVAEQHSRVNIVDPGGNPAPRDEIASGHQLSFLAELGLVATYQLRPNLALRASYDFVYVQGVALAPQQLQFNTAAAADINTGSYVLLDGGSIGIEYVW